MKLQIIETPDYVLAVSDEEIKEGDTYLFDVGYAHGVKIADGDDIRQLHLEIEPKKIIAHQPKGNAAELDLPLLPEIVVEDDVEKFVKLDVVLDLINDQNLHLLSGGSVLIKLQNITNNLYNAANKTYSEEDLRKAIKMAWEADSIDGIVDLNIVLHYGRNNDLRTKWSEDEIIQSLKQLKTPKWFVAEVGTIHCDRCPNGFEQYFETTTKGGKTYLVGTYLYE
jgi:hypothetical protein